jgi:hypothetical protein
MRRISWIIMPLIAFGLLLGVTSLRTGAQVTPPVTGQPPEAVQPSPEPTRALPPGFGEPVRATPVVVIATPMPRGGGTPRPPSRYGSFRLVDCGYAGPLPTPQRAGPTLSGSFVTRTDIASVKNSQLYKEPKLDPKFSLVSASSVAQGGTDIEVTLGYRAGIADVIVTRRTMLYDFFDVHGICEGTNEVVEKITINGQPALFRHPVADLHGAGSFALYIGSPGVLTIVEAGNLSAEETLQIGQSF